MKKTIKQKAPEKKIEGKGAALFIPAGFLIGMGFGFLINNVPAGMFLGLGIGFLTWAVIEVGIKK